jgi:uncharacterized protein YjbI with pentapeptide repeats
MRSLNDNLFKVFKAPGANLYYVNFTGVDLTNANFTGANLTGANFTGTNLLTPGYTLDLMTIIKLKKVQ